MRSLKVIASTAWAVLGINVSAQATFIPLGDLPGGDFLSVGTAISSDGWVVTGHSSEGIGLGGSEGFRWTAAGGMTSLARTAGFTGTSGISSKGQFIAGSIQGVPGINGVRGAIWTAAGDFHMVGDLPGGAEYSILGGVSDNGIAVGASSYADGQFGPLNQAIRWTPQGGIEPLGFLPGDDSSFAVEISADGTVIAGRGRTGNWFWTEDAGMTFALGTEFETQGMTEDGKYLYGVFPQLHDGRTVGVGFIWSEDSGIVELNHNTVPATWWGDIARAASSEADVILGMRFAQAGGGSPYIWFDQGKSGMLFEDYLLAHNLDIQSHDYHITEVVGMSDDGTRFLVNTFNAQGDPEAVLIIVPTPCPADVNGDGELTPSDFTAWIGAFQNSLPACDQNGDGVCTPGDFAAWIANYNAGC